MRYFTISGKSVDEITTKVLKKYGGKAYIISFSKEIKEEEDLNRKWHEKMLRKRKIIQTFYYKAYCGLPENEEELQEISQERQEIKFNQAIPLKQEKKHETLESKIPLNKPDVLEEFTEENSFESEETSLLKKKDSLLNQEFDYLKSRMDYIRDTKAEILREENMKYLLKQDFSYNFATELLDSMQTPIENIEMLKVILKEKLRLDINFTSGIPYTPGECYLFLGSTGVGKTTTLAKLAAVFYQQGLRDFSFLSFDSYRLGADEQLRRYANVFEKSFDLIQSQEELASVLEGKSHKEILFLDTAGESLDRDVKLSEVKKYLKYFNRPIRTVLVLSASSKIQDLKLIKNRFKEFYIDYYILTKIDETKTTGSVLEFLYKNEVPSIYYTDGQDVPLDIKKFSLEDFFKYF